MKNIEWFPFSKEEELILLEKHYNYAKGFFKSNNLLLISELAHKEIYQRYNIVTLSLNKDCIISSDFFDTHVVKVNNKNILYLNFYDESKSSFWRKI